jgi:hypothetical protein
VPIREASSPSAPLFRRLDGADGRTNWSAGNRQKLCRLRPGQFSKVGMRQFIETEEFAKEYPRLDYRPYRP